MVKIVNIPQLPLNCFKTSEGIKNNTKDDIQYLNPKKKAPNLDDSSVIEHIGLYLSYIRR